MSRIDLATRVFLAGVVAAMPMICCCALPEADSTASEVAANCCPVNHSPVEHADPCSDDADRCACEEVQMVADAPSPTTAAHDVAARLHACMPNAAIGQPLSARLVANRFGNDARRSVAGDSLRSLSCLLTT
ncbi:MAG: hypothetical protein CMJ18_22890 [Phycisphaeraceae bacterium]|nr:hypothetical protein [Phycisphaeraceae bacterium]